MNQPHSETFDTFDVAGAGKLIVRGPSSTGGAKGVSIALSWVRDGAGGGVLDKKEMKRLIQCLCRHMNTRETIEDALRDLRVHSANKVDHNYRWSASDLATDLADLLTKEKE